MTSLLGNDVWKAATEKLGTSTLFRGRKEEQESVEGRRQGALLEGRRQEALLATFLRHWRAMPVSVDIEVVDVTLVDIDCGRPANGHKITGT